MLAALKAGAVAIPCSEMLRSKDLDFRVRHSGATLLVADPRCRAEVEAMAEQPGLVYLDEAALDETDTHHRGHGRGRAGVHPLHIRHDQGPEGVVHTHRYTWAKRAQAEHWLDARPGDLVWCTAGTGWAKSIWNVLLGPWSCGSAVVLHEGDFDPAERFRLLEELGPTVLCQAPTEYRLMAKLDGIERHDLSRVRHMVSAGRAAEPGGDPRVRGRFRAHDPRRLRADREHAHRRQLPRRRDPARLDGLPAPGYDVRVIDWDGNEAPPGEEGDIALRGDAPALFAGYWDAPDETAAVHRGDWYVTGDRAVRDEDGYLWFTGRADDVILSAAYRIGPFEVESALLEHAGGRRERRRRQARPDRGQIVKAFVVLRPGHEASGALVWELQEHCKRVTAPYKYPREIEFVAELPKTRSGKIRRVELRKLEEERAAG